MFLETARLQLREMHTADVLALVQLWTDPQAMQYMGGPRDVAELRQLLAETLQTPAERYDLWPVIEKASAQLVGHCGLLDKEIAGRAEVELVYVFAPSAWGKGYAAEIGRALKTYAYEELGLSRLVALIDPANRGSMRVAEKVGLCFEQEVVRPDGAVKRLYAAVLTSP